MKNWIYRSKIHFTNSYFQKSLIAGLLMLAASLIVNFYASRYATTHASSTVADIVLSNIPTYDVSEIFTFGPVLMWLFFIFLTFREPKRLPFVLKSITLFILIRSVFITLTHLGPYQPISEHVPWLIQQYTFAGDLFFSAHTGFPFLMALLLWDHKPLRYFFIFCSVFFGIVVLLGHYHYSIDVLGAFFITFTIHHIATVLFPKDLALFKTETVRRPA